MNPQNHFTFARSLVAVSFLNLFIHFVAVLVWCAFCTVASGQMTVSKYYQDDGHGSCITWGGSDTACGNLAVTVSGDAMPGDYTYDLLCNPDIIGDGGNYVRICCGYGHQTTVHVNADHTYTLNPDSGLACMGNAGGKGLSRLYLTVAAPSGSVHNEGSVNVSIASVYCAGSPVTLYADIPVTIGSSTGSPYTKQCDRKNGGDAGAGGNGCQSCNAPPMARYSAHSMLASLNIEDTPMRYVPPRGPAIDFTVTYNQRDTQQPQSFNYSNLGPKWTFNWLSYVTDDPNNTSANATVYVAGGGAEKYSGFDSGSQSYQADPQSHAVLARTAPAAYEKRFPDGSKQVFGLSDGSSSFPRKIFMTQWVDPTGNAVTIGYDASFRVTTLADALGQVTTVAYELPSDPLKITKVTEPFSTGRFATFTYTNGQLTNITDEIGIQSIFTYATDGTNFITSLQTPYGTTTFSTGQSGTNKWIEMTDPLGGKERVEYRDNAPGISASESTAPAGMTNSGLDVANTFYWDKKSIEMYPPVNDVYDYTKARIIHWIVNPDGTFTGITGSEKAPLENRVWYSYAGQSDTNHVGSSANPSKIARALGDGSTQLWQYEYNSIGKMTKSTDPVGRVMSYIYDSNNIDLLQVRQTTGSANELLHKFAYNSQHEPLAETDTAGQVTTFTYNPYGQMLTRKNAKNETTTFAYGDAVLDGYLASITSPPFNGISAVTTFTYDNANRVRTVTDSDGYVVTTDYDNLDRPTQISYPDGTNQQFQYSQDFGQGVTNILDLTKSKDRRGQWTTRHYNANRQMDSITDPLSRTTQFGWCSCGSLTSITDPKNQVTTFHRDLQGRIYQKVFADNTSISYLYDGQTAANTFGASSRLKSVTDAKTQRANYSYFVDDNIQQITYTNTSGQPLNPPTPSVSFTYDPNYNRVKTMVDGSGTTTYGYNPIAIPPVLGAGQLASIDGPLTNDIITFTYDQLGRVTNRSINGTSNSAAWSFDSLGRVSATTNKLGIFNYGYVNVTDRLGSMTYPDGGSTVYSYFPNALDKRLQQIKNQTSSNALISQFDYTYDTEGQILTWTENYPGLSPAPQRFDLGYDNADQLTGASLKNASTNALIKQYTYGYDVAANRTSEIVGTTTTTSTPNNLNEIISQSGGTNRTLTYDANGSLINDGSSRTFEWDGANRLVAVNYTGTTKRSEFSYDGLSRMVKIVEKSGKRITSTRKFVWCGMEKCEFRDGNDTVSLFVYPQGQVSGTSPYFYTRDHLGSIREMRSTGKKGAIVARFDYDPYGRSTAVISNTLADFNFTGLYRHSATNLDLAVYRAYDPDLGRWLNRDPLRNAELREGVNLYGYTGNDPSDGVDPLGLWKAYGNWCGPGWTGGRREVFNRHRAGFYSPPIDGLDAACVKHDICYYKCRQTHSCDPGARSDCFRGCDHHLTSAAYAVGGFWGNMIGAAIDRPGKRDPEENEPSCSCGQK
jgi:RHS repeat-associated protein